VATKFPPPSPPFIRARNQGGRQTPKAIVLHGTVSSDNAGTARNIAEWWNGPGSPMSSAHYVVDPKEVIQCVGDHSVAYHCGYNQDSIGVEFCDEQQGPARRWDDADSNAILQRAAVLVAELSLAYDIEVRRPSTAELRSKGPHGIYGHNDSRLAFGRTTHTDPRDFPWDKFLRLVKHEVENLKGGSSRPTKPENTGTMADRLDPKAYFVGARGGHVKWLANRLVEQGFESHYKNGVDKAFSAGEDREAVAAFQAASGIRGTGLPSALTLKLLDEGPAPAPVPVPVDPPDVDVWVDFALASINLGKGTFDEKVEDLNSLVALGVQAIGVQEAGDRELELNEFLAQNPTWGMVRFQTAGGPKVPVLYDTTVLRLNQNNSRNVTTDIADGGWVGEGAGPDRINKKGLTHAAFTHIPTGRRVHILNHHLVASHRRAGLPTKAKRARQKVAADQAAAFNAEREKCAGIVFGTGDWNSGRKWVLAVTGDMIIDSNSGATHQNSEIDYVSHFPNANVEVVESFLVETSGSRKYEDHRAVVVRYRIEVAR
jgi:N-acetyl-anhydromuramyl-L-alanine amidase AmpD